MPGPAAGLFRRPAAGRRERDRRPARPRRSALAAGLLALAALACGRTPERPTARNLVLVVVDTLRQDRVSAYGYERRTTPGFDRLAAEGTIADGLAPSSWTRPSAATIFTGLSPLRNQVAVKTDRIPVDLPTLPEILEARGYSTLGVTTNGHVSAAWGFGRGFDELIATWKVGLGHDTPADQVNAEVGKRLAALKPPFFLYVHYLDPHQPYSPQMAWDGSALPPELAALAPLAEGALLKGAGGSAPGIVAAASELYDGEVRTADLALEDLLARLRAHGLDRQTLTVVTSDHGEEFGEHGRVGHGKSLFQEVLRVPVVFHAPGIVASGRRLGLFPLESLVPTMLGLLAGRDARELPGFDGPSFADAFAGRGDEPAVGPRLLYLEGDPDAGLALIEGSWKLLLHLQPYRKALYRLDRDPGETSDLSAANDGSGRFPALARTLAERYGTALRSAHSRSSTTADAELSKQLAALGYGGASQPQFAQRVFPRRLRAADPRPGGPRGWENVDGFSSCAATVEDPAQQLLLGWFGPAPGETGRWTAPAATLGIAAPAAPAAVTAGYRLVLEGISWRPAPTTLEFGPVPGAPARERVAPGPFRVERPIDASAARDGWILVRLATDAPFVPSEHGIADDRSLGLFFTRYCLEPAAGS